MRPVMSLLRKNLVFQVGLFTLSLITLQCNLFSHVFPIDRGLFQNPNDIFCVHVPSASDAAQHRWVLNGCLMELNHSGQF